MQHTYETHEIYGCNMCSSTCCSGKWRPVDAKLNTDAELDAIEWCGAHWQHEPWQRPRQEARVRSGACGMSGGCTGEAGSVPRAGMRNAQSKQATRTRAAWVGSVPQVGDIGRGHRTDGRPVTALPENNTDSDHKHSLNLLMPIGPDQNFLRLPSFARFCYYCSCSTIEQSHKSITATFKPSLFFLKKNFG